MHRLLTASRTSRMGRKAAGNSFVLRVTEQDKIKLFEGEFKRVVGRRTLKVDVRIIAATHRDLEHAVAAGNFCEDLFYRLSVMLI